MKSQSATLAFAGTLRRMPRLKLSLLRQFSLISFLLLGAIAVLLAWGIQQQLEQNALRQAADSAADQVTLILDKNLSQADLSKPLDPARFAQIDTLVRQNIISAHIVRVKIWGLGGLLLYSDEKDLVGQRFPVDGELNEALDGTIAMDMSSLGKRENIGERGLFTRLMEVYIPLRPTGSTQIVGAYEAYQNTDVLQPRIDEMHRFVWGSIALGFMILYGSLFTIVRKASGDLVRRNEENARLYEETKQRLVERKEAQEQVQRQLDRLAALRSIDIAITASHDLDVTLDVFLGKLIAQLHVDAADVLLLNPHTQMLEYAAGRGFHVYSTTRSRLRPGEGYPGRAALERRTINIPDLAEVTDFMHAPLVTGELFVAYYAVPLIAKGQVKGVLEIFQRSTLEPDPEWLNFLETLAGQAAIAVDNATLFSDLQSTIIELALAYDTTLEGWSIALDLRDKETEGHAQRVTGMTLRLAQVVGLGEEELVHVRRGALLHDIGKMGIPDSILLKPGPLTDEEWAIMRRHPVYAYEMLSRIDYLRPALDIPYCHHEKWDGSGYPRGLKGEQIPLSARIFAVVDVWDALRSDRPYRLAWPEEKVVKHIQSLSGTHFDPKAVEAFFRMGR
jgi:HD-GYP domain-containing protein (c-di-GMP phosphodiesterase class II)